MKTIVTTSITMLLLLFVNNAMAESGSRNRHDGYKSRGQRVEQSLDAKGDRIERRLDHKAAVAAEQGKYRLARHLQKKGDRIDRHLDRKGKQIHARLEQRSNCRQQQHQHIHAYPQVAYPAVGQRHNSNFVSVMIQQPGLWLGWGVHR